MVLLLAVASSALAMEATTTAVLNVRARVEQTCVVSTQIRARADSRAPVRSDPAAARNCQGAKGQPAVVITSRNGQTVFEF